MSRYRLLKFLIPFFLGFYVVMIWLKPVIGVTHDEVFPFFAWTLFDVIPEWYVTENALVVHSIDGEPVSGTRYLIPTGNIRDQKALGTTVNDCVRLAACNDAVKQRLYPIVNRLAEGNDVEFSIIEARIDLREVQRGIYGLAEGEAKRTDFFQLQIENTIGRWTTGGGRSQTGNWDGSYEAAKLLARSYFAVFLCENNLIYVRDSCDQADLDARFFLHLYPADANDLPSQRKKYATDNLDFNFGDYQFRLDEECITVRPVPAYAIRRIQTGQFTSEQGQYRHLWEVDIELAPAGGKDE